MRMPNFATRLAVVGLALLAASSGPAVFEQSQASAAPSAAAPGPITKTVTATRTHLVNGADVPVLSKTVSVTVSTTANLRDRQNIDVSWSGAKPTGGIIADSNSGFATQQEYPMVLLQCRGAAGQIQPDTCWAPTPAERYTFDNDTVTDLSGSFPAWRVDRYATPADRQEYVNAPTPRPDHCPSQPQSEHWLPFHAANGTDFYGGPNGCAGLPPEASTNDATLALPSNATYAATGLDGTGNAQFNVRDASDIASLGCSDTVACALVVVPVVGISCDIAAAALPVADRPAPGDEADAATKKCEKTGAYKAGEFGDQLGHQDVAVSGALWWSASNWRNRLEFPLSFAQATGACELVGGNSPVLIYGSELMIQATAQWAPKFCLDSAATPVKHVQTGEPQARNLLGVKSIEAAMVSGPPGDSYTVPTVHAPIAVTGFAISYAIDGANRDPYTQLKLTPRLLAKLMTESYPAVPAIKKDYPSLSANPLNITLDPEFIALNPGITKGVGATISASSLFSIASDSDVIQALTEYIDADPEARAWLNGTPDPWGMTVNPYYKLYPDNKAISLPTDNWPLLDTFKPTSMYQTGLNDCLHDAPVPYLPLVASPTSRIANIALAMQFAIANSQTVCLQPLQGTSAGEKLVALGRQSKGFRFMIGLTSLADAHRFGLATAALESQSTVSPSAQIADASGRTFVAPTDAGLGDAVKMLQPDDASHSWPVPYDAMRTQPAGATAYPGTMLVYADVPTQGLPKADAAAYAAWLSYAAGAGQTPGSDVGQLPPGYLPMTAGNGMARFVTYTTAAATAVSQQKGVVPPLVVVPAAATTPTPHHNATSASSVPSSAAPVSAAPPPAPVGSSSAAVAPVKAVHASTSAAAPSSVQAAPVAKTVGQQDSAASAILIALLALVLLGPLAAPVTIFFARRGSRV